MKIAFSWLKEYLPVEMSVEQAAELLTDIGLEVEGIEHVSSIPGELEGLVVGKILTCGKHPNADRLSVTTVDVGAKEPFSIVCGAPNVAVGQFVIVALPGTTLYPTKGDAFTIKKGKIRGEESNGMICAEDEIGLGSGHDGILVLDKEYAPGTPANVVFKVFTDEVMEIGLTPNRTDAMCHYGVGRDLRAAIRSREKNSLSLQLPSISGFSVNEKSQSVKITIEDNKRCLRYAGLRIKGVKMGPSPDWMQARLKSIGLRPINLVVDVTNYVLHETGHPLHAFDADRIEGGQIIVKTLPEGIEFTTLDGVKRKLSAEDLCICDEGGPLVLAGVFGGEKAEVQDETVNIFLESALFDPVSIRKSARRHGLNTDASFRYERGVDPEMTIYALKRAALLIMNFGGGSISMDIDDVYPKNIEPSEVKIKISNVQKLIGKNIPSTSIKEILSNLEIKIKSDLEDTLVLQVPAYRADVTREADIIEEVLRIYGFNNVEVPGKMHIVPNAYHVNPNEALVKQLSVQLTGMGYYECLNNALINKRFAIDSSKQVEMLNPLSQELSILRQSLIPGLATNAAHNIRRNNKRLKLYEWGKKYEKLSEGKYKETHLLTLLISGKSHGENWLTPNQDTTFHHLSSHVYRLFKMWGIEITNYKEAQHPLLDGGVEWFAESRMIGYGGAISAELDKALEVDQPTYVAELNWDEILECIKDRKLQYQELPRFPSVRRDLALLLPENVQYHSLERIAFNTEKKLLRKVNLFDVYQGKGIDAGMKSYALSFLLQDDSKTLNDKQIDTSMERILNALVEEAGAKLRT
jgi:phenylalanyl-tRNA synthetase beta chain